MILEKDILVLVHSKKTIFPLHQKTTQKTMLQIEPMKLLHHRSLEHTSWVV